MNCEKIYVTQYAGCIDQTLLSPSATEDEAAAFCREAACFGFASVCVNPAFVPLAAEILKNSGVKVCTVIDFPLGAGGFDTKEAQAKAAVWHGAEELDFVIDLALVKAHKWRRLAHALENVNRRVKDFSSGASSGVLKGGASVVTKLILETCFLSPEEIRDSCVCAKDAGFDFVKTSTGFAIVKSADGVLLPNGATTDAVRLMRASVGDGMGVKASGGIRCASDFLAMIEAGANRIGTSSGVKILQEFSNGESA